MFNLPKVDDLKRALAQYGIRAGDLAREAKVDKSIVSKILNRKYNPSYEMMARLFGALNKMIEKGAEPVSDAMIRSIVTSDADESISSVIAKMRKGGFSQIPVISGGKFVGMVTERSLLLRKEGAARAGDVLGGDYMVVGPETPLDRVRQALATAQAVAVVRDGRLVGLLTKADVIK